MCGTNVHGYIRKFEGTCVRQSILTSFGIYRSRGRASVAKRVCTHVKYRTDTHTHMHIHTYLPTICRFNFHVCTDKKSCALVLPSLTYIHTYVCMCECVCLCVHICLFAANSPN